MGVTERSGSLIAAQWGQEIPYNNKLPIWKDTIRAVTGCSTTAVAQLLYHYGYPSSINGKTLDWNLMKRHIRYSDPPTILNHQPAHENIAILFQELVKSEYLDASFADSDEENSTGVNKSRVTKTLRKLGYNTNDVADYNLQAVMGTIRQGRPVLVRGNTHRTPIKFLGIILSYTYSGGHAWICDHLIVRTQVTKWYRGDELIKTYTQTQNLLHCNWGWDNRSNGYFLPSTRFNIAHMVHVDGTRAEGAEGNYQYNLEMWDQIRR